MPPLWLLSLSFSSTSRATSVSSSATSGLAALRPYSATTLRRGPSGVKNTKKRPLLS